MPDLPQLHSENLLPQGALRLGLGCSRLGSVNGATREEAHELLQIALDGGIRFFDTSNIYGQGDSERVLGQILGQRADCVVCSKAGKHLSLRSRLLLPFKQMLRGTVRRSTQASRSVSAVRSKPMPTRWDPQFLLNSLDASLRSLGRPRIEIFMLHSPPIDVVRHGDAVGALENAQRAGKIGLVGVSVDDAATAAAAMLDPRVQILQLPLRPDEAEYDQLVRQAARQGVAVIAREIFGGAGMIKRAKDSAQFARDRVGQLIHTPGVLLPLVGTISPKHLLQAIDAAHAADGCASAQAGPATEA